MNGTDKEIENMGGPEPRKLSPNRMEFNYKVANESCIDMEYKAIINEKVTFMQKWIVDTRETAIREALIKLGWTPPKEDSNGT